MCSGKYFLFFFFAVFVIYSFSALIRLNHVSYFYSLSMLWLCIQNAHGNSPCKLCGFLRIERQRQQQLKCLRCIEPNIKRTSTFAFMLFKTVVHGFFFLYYDCRWSLNISFNRKVETLTRQITRHSDFNFCFVFCLRVRMQLCHIDVIGI